MNIPKVNFSSVKSGMKSAVEKGGAFVAKGLSDAKLVVKDAKAITTIAPASTAVIAGTAIAGAAALVELSKLAKAGVQNIADRKYN